MYAVIHEVRENYLRDDPMLEELMKAVKPIFESDEKYTGNLSKLNDTKILDKISLYRGNRSYTINKEKVYLCLKDEKDEYYNRNMLIYVLLHELAHVICDEIGHTEKFHDIFQNLLMRAINNGIYNPSIPVIQNYCNHTE
jgi:hypothetical protein